MRVITQKGFWLVGQGPPYELFISAPLMSYLFLFIWEGEPPGEPLLAYACCGSAGASPSPKNRTLFLSASIVRIPHSAFRIPLSDDA
jgi:hypothetical protein